MVTLAVTPEDAERIALAASEGRSPLALRNPLDVAPTETSGVQAGRLLTATAGRGPGAGAARRPRAPPEPSQAGGGPAVPPVFVPPPSGPAKIYAVETIRAAKRSEEVVR